MRIFAILALTAIILLVYLISSDTKKLQYQESDDEK